jgi:hypothetical protein
MTDQKRLVLDANVLLRAVFGVRVRYGLRQFQQLLLFAISNFKFQTSVHTRSCIQGTAYLGGPLGQMASCHKMCSILSLPRRLQSTMAKASSAPTRVWYGSSETRVETEAEAVVTLSKGVQLPGLRTL